MHERIDCTVIVPCRNEITFIAKCLDSIISNDYPASRIEVIIADGDSNDGSRQLLDHYAAQHANLRIISNPQRTAAAALNRAIVSARGDVIIRVDAHSTIAPNYISRCLHSLESSGADNVGGIMFTHASAKGVWARAIVCALSHKFGVGNSTFRVHSDEPKWVDTVFGGCYRREVFSKIGYFNEKLVRGQDMEFNQRLTSSGGRILLDPGIVSHYFARTEIRSFVRHNWGNGVWAILPFRYSEVMPVGLRHLVPMLSMAVGLGLLIAGVFSTMALQIMLVVVTAYITASAYVSLQIAVRERSAALLFSMPPVFALLHVPYGLGSLWAGVRLMFAADIWRRLLSLRTNTPSS